MLPLKASQQEQRSVICFLWRQGLSTNAIHSEMRPLYGNCFTRAAVHVWCKRVSVEKVLLRKDDLAAVLL